MTAPCGVPSSDGAHVPSSRTPAFSHLPIRRSMRLSPIRCSRNRWTRTCRSRRFSSRPASYCAQVTPVHPRCRLPPQPEKGPPEQVDGHVMEEGGEPCLPLPPRGLPYAVQRLGHACPALRLARALLARIPLGPAPSLVASAAGRPALFGDFPGTMGGSDFPWSYIIGFRRLPSRCGPPARGQRTTRGSPGSRVGGFQPCEGSLTMRGRIDARHGAPARVAFRSSLQRRHPGLETFRGSIPCPPVPLSTLRRHPYGWLRMTRGRRDWLVQRFRHSIQGCLPVRQGSQAFLMNLLSVPVY
jgi:hypothetical protein